MALFINPPPSLLPLGDSAWTIQLGSRIDSDLHERVVGLGQRIEQQRSADPLLATITDVVPTFRSVTVHFDPHRTNADALGRQLLALAHEDRRSRPNGRHWTLPVCFDDEFAPDLPQLCHVTGLSRDAAIQRLLSVRLRVYMLGFQPGFAYLGRLPAELVLPRLASPRQAVSAQSVAVAGEMCAVYPWQGPGGWNLLGRTPALLFDAQHERPALLAAGDEVQWTAIDRVSHDRLVAEIARGLAREAFLREPAA